MLRIVAESYPLLLLMVAPYIHTEPTSQLTKEKRRFPTITPNDTPFQTIIETLQILDFRTTLLLIIVR